MVYIALAILSLAFLIVVHEAGHYFVARWCGMRIERFSIGFGPGLIKRRSKKTGTIFQVAPIPFGGFVEIRGMNIAEEVDPEDRFAYPNRPAWQRFVTIFAGPATNYVSAIVLAFALYTCHGFDSSWRWYGVGEVNSGFDAAGKLVEGDRILAVDHVPLLAVGDYQVPGGPVLHGDSLVARVNAKHGAPVDLTISRGGKQLDVEVQPRLAIETLLMAYKVDPQLIADLAKVMSRLPKAARPSYLLGIAPTAQADPISAGVLESGHAALVYPVEQTRLIAGGLWEIVTGKEKADPRGPKGIYDEFTKAWKLGPVTGIKLLMLLSVYLGLFNLFPLPALDGGRLVFLGYEMVTRRRANPKIEAMVHMAGIMVLGVVMILVTMRDFGVFS